MRISKWVVGHRSLVKVKMNVAVGYGSGLVRRSLVREDMGCVQQSAYLVIVAT